MKLPRWLVILMLTTSLLAVLAAAGWWWVTWPERTAREFIERFGNTAYVVQPESRSPSDIILARSRFKINAARLREFTIVRGCVLGTLSEPIDIKGSPQIVTFGIPLDANMGDIEEYVLRESLKMN